PSLADYVTLNTSQTVTGDKVFSGNLTVPASTTTLEEGGKLLQHRVDGTNAAGTNAINWQFSSSTGNLTHTFASAATTNRTYTFDANGGSIPNKTNTQSISGAWTFSNQLALTRAGQ